MLSYDKQILPVKKNTIKTKAKLVQNKKKFHGTYKILLKFVQVEVGTVTLLDHIKLTLSILFKFRQT